MCMECDRSFSFFIVLTSTYIFKHNVTGKVIYNINMYNYVWIRLISILYIIYAFCLLSEKSDLRINKINQETTYFSLLASWVSIWFIMKNISTHFSRYMCFFPLCKGQIYPRSDVSMCCYMKRVQ